MSSLKSGFRLDAKDETIHYVQGPVFSWEVEIVTHGHVLRPACENLEEDPEKARSTPPKLNKPACNVAQRDFCSCAWRRQTQEEAPVFRVHQHMPIMAMFLLLMDPV